MAEKKYKLASPEAITRYGRSQDPDAAPLEIGDTVELELSDDEERAVVAAGWLEPAKKGDS